MDVFIRTFVEMLVLAFLMIAMIAAAGASLFYAVAFFAAGEMGLAAMMLCLVPISIAAEFAAALAWLER